MADLSKPTPEVFQFLVRYSDVAQHKIDLNDIAKALGPGTTYKRAWDAMNKARKDLAAAGYVAPAAEVGAVGGEMAVGGGKKGSGKAGGGKAGGKSGGGSGTRKRKTKPEETPEDGSDQNGEEASVKGKKVKVEDDGAEEGALDGEADAADGVI